MVPIFTVNVALISSTIGASFTKFVSLKLKAVCECMWPIWVRIITGASPRASQSLFKTCRASAAIDGRDYVIPDDIKNIALQVVSHRIVLKPESKIRGVTGQHVMRKILGEVVVPVIQ